MEGEKGAHDYVATFHRHTRQIALTLPKETPITVSVINIVAYPGKPPPKPKKR